MQKQSLGIVSGTPADINRIAMGLHHEVHSEIVVAGEDQWFLVAPLACLDGAKAEQGELRECAERLRKGIHYHG